MKQKVSIVRLDDCDFEGAIRAAVELAGGLVPLVRYDSHVVVKPNLARMEASGSGAITDARATRAVTKLVLDLNPASVVIAEGTAVGYDDGCLGTGAVFDLSGTSAVARDLGVPCVYLNTDEAVPVEVPQPRAMDRVLVARTILESDVVISVPVLKTHPRVNATCALKNMFGTLPGTEKRAAHMLGINDSLIDLFSVLRPHYSIVDGSVAMEGTWRVPQDSRMLGLVLAGKDALAVDLVGCALMGIDPDSVLYLRHMTRWPGEVRSLRDVEVVGEAIETHAERFRTAFDVIKEGYPDVRFIEGPSFCGGCVAELVSALRHVKGAGYGELMKGLTIVVGNPEEVEASEKMVVIGGCSEALEEFGPLAVGCPPAEDAVIEAMCEAIGADSSLVMSIRDDTRQQLWDDTRHFVME